MAKKKIKLIEHTPKKGVTFLSGSRKEFDLSGDTGKVQQQFQANEARRETILSGKNVTYSNQTYGDLNPDIKNKIITDFKKNVKQYQFQYDSITKPPTDTPASAFSYAKQSKPPQKYTGFEDATSFWKGTTPYRYKNTGMLAPDLKAVDYIKGLVDASKKSKTISISGHKLPSEVVRQIADTDLVRATWQMNFEKGKNATKFRVFSQEAKSLLEAYTGNAKAMAKEFKGEIESQHYDIPEGQTQLVKESTPRKVSTKERVSTDFITYPVVEVNPEGEAQESPTHTVKKSSHKITRTPVSLNQARNEGGTYGGFDLPDKDLPKSTVLTEISKELHDVLKTTPEDVPEGFVDDAGFIDEQELKHSGFQIGDLEKPEAGALVVQEPALSTSPQAKRAKELGNLIVEQQRDMRSDRTTTLTDTQLKPEFSGGKESEMVREGQIVKIDQLDRSPFADAQRTARVTEQDLNIQIAKKGSKDLKNLQLNLRDAKKQVPKEPNLAVSWDVEKPVTLQQARDVARKTTETILTGSNIDRGKPYNVLDVSLLNEGPYKPLGPTIPQQESYEISQSLNKPKQKVQSRERSWKSRLVQSRGAKVLTALATIPGLDFLLTPVDVAQAHDTVIKPRQEKYGGSGLASGRDRDYGKVMQAGKRKVTPLTEFKNWKEWDAVKGFSAWAKNRSLTARSLRR